MLLFALRGIVGAMKTQSKQWNSFHIYWPYTGIFFCWGFFEGLMLKFLQFFTKDFLRGICWNLVLYVRRASCLYQDCVHSVVQRTCSSRILQPLLVIRCDICIPVCRKHSRCDSHWWIWRGLPRPGDVPSSWTSHHHSRQDHVRSIQVWRHQATSR